MTHKFNTIYILGGHKLAYDYSQKICAAKGALLIDFKNIVLIDAEASCYAASRIQSPVSLATKPYHEFILEYLTSHPQDLGTTPDTFVPDHTAPHVMLQVFRTLAQNAVLCPFELAAEIPFKKSLENGAIWAVSYATWLCPADCAEPGICPHTTQNRDWDFNASMSNIIDTIPCKNKPTNAFIFSCAPLVAEIAQIPVAQIRKRVRGFCDLLAEQSHPLEVLVATHSHCHGIIGKFSIDFPVNL